MIKIKNTEKLPGLHLVLKDHSFFHVPYRLSSIVPDALSFGCYENNRFVRDKEKEDELIVYIKNFIGRGIRVHRDSDQRTVHVDLELPCSKEEIEAYFEVVIRGANKRLYEVLLNGQPLLPKNIEAVIQNAKSLNLKLLHKVMAEVLNDDCVITFNAIKGKLAAGISEAETMWAGIDTDTYRDWLHHLQEEDYYVCYPKVVEDDGNLCGIYTFPAQTAVLLPIEPLNYITRDRGQSIDTWFVEPVNSHLESIGKIPFTDFTGAIGQRFVHYYDAIHQKIDSLSEEELNRICKSTAKDENLSC